MFLNLSDYGGEDIEEEDLDNGGEDLEMVVRTSRTCLQQR